MQGERGEDRLDQRLRPAEIRDEEDQLRAPREAAGGLQQALGAAPVAGRLAEARDRGLSRGTVAGRGKRERFVQGGIAADQPEAVADARGRARERRAEGLRQPEPVGSALEAHGGGEIDERPGLDGRAGLEPAHHHALERVAQGGPQVDPARIRQAQEGDLIAESAESAGIAPAMGADAVSARPPARPVEDVGPVLRAAHGAGTVSNTARIRSGTICARRIS